MRDRLVSLHPEENANGVAAKAFDEQAEFADVLESTVMQGVSGMIDSQMVDSFKAAAQDAVMA